MGDAIGVVCPETLVVTEPLCLSCGTCLPAYELVYETYGRLNERRSNAILIAHALSGNHHAAGFHGADDAKPGWWDTMIGPGKSIDTGDFFVVCLNNLGGCHGSTGPTSMNPATGEPYGADFPVVTVRDWVESQARLADALGIDAWFAVIGGSLGGMQALQWSIQYPKRVRQAVIIASAARLSAQNIAFNEVARQAIMSDQQFHQGYYQQQQPPCAPKKGLSLARMIGHITYQSDDAMSAKFDRELQDDTLDFDFAAQFQVESYLRYQGAQFSGQFDANTYLLMTKALDHFDPAHGYEDLAKALDVVRCRFLVISFSSDWRFAPQRSEEIRDALLAQGKDVSYLEIEASQGHDAFLMTIPRYQEALRHYLQHAKAAEGVCGLGAL